MNRKMRSDEECPHLIYEFMEIREIHSLAHLSRLIRRDGEEVRDLVNGELAPRSFKNGAMTWHPLVIRLAAFFGVVPDMLFPEAPSSSIPASDMQPLTNEIEAPSSSRPDFLCEERDLHQMLRDVLGGMSHRDVDILKLRLGEGKSLRVVGRELHISAERVRRLQPRALARIRRKAPVSQLCRLLQS